MCRAFGPFFAAVLSGNYRMGVGGVCGVGRLSVKFLDELCGGLAEFFFKRFC